MSSKIQISLILGFAVFCGIIQSKVVEKLQLPFIDEIFHIHQCLEYCQYNFSHWDSKITTPPGLYYLGFIWAKFLGVWGFNGINVLRSLNLFGGLVVLPLMVYYLNVKDMVNIIALPLLIPYYFLFYTDIWSLILIIASLAAANTRSPRISAKYSTISAICGFISLWFRQTNIVWIGFIAVFFIDKTIPRSSFVSHVKNFILQSLKNWIPLIPYVIDILLFAVFLKINGGITLGDKENHQVQLHVVQVFYCVTFINFFTWPSWLSIQKLNSYKQFWFAKKPFGSILNLGLCYGIHYTITNFTIVHPFLLADNRHYTFYIWRRILSKPYSKWLMIPIYHFGSWNIIESLHKNRHLSPISILTFILATIITIVPSPLFEPRYYIIPLVLFKIFSESPRVIPQFLWSSIINIGIMYVFFNYEFEWATEQAPQRIIW